jgi:hypothetical protein
MFFYPIMNIFITLLENVNKSRTSAGSLSLRIFTRQVRKQVSFWEGRISERKKTHWPAGEWVS